MALLDRFSNDISVHGFTSAMALWATGDITRQNIIDSWTLTAEDQSDLTKLENFYSGLTNNGKIAFKNKLESVLILYEEDRLTRQQVINLLGLN
jgi:hypothetical protein